MSEYIGLRPATRRNTRANYVIVFGVRVLFSYETPVAFHDPELGPVRRRNEWGPTTGRHLKETSWGMGKQLEADEFNERLDALLLSRLVTEVSQRIDYANGNNQASNLAIT